MGPYCDFCGHRCFVRRDIPSGPAAGKATILATCRAGMDHDQRTTGYTHQTAINPTTGQPGVFGELRPADDGLVGRDKVRALLIEADRLGYVMDVLGAHASDRFHERRMSIDEELAGFVPDLIAAVTRVEVLLARRPRPDGPDVADTVPAEQVHAALAEGPRCARCTGLLAPDAPVGSNTVCTSCAPVDTR